MLSDHGAYPVIFAITTLVHKTHRKQSANASSVLLNPNTNKESNIESNIGTTDFQLPMSFNPSASIVTVTSLICNMPPRPAIEYLT